MKRSEIVRFLVEEARMARRGASVAKGLGASALEVHYRVKKCKFMAAARAIKRN